MSNVVIMKMLSGDEVIATKSRDGEYSRARVVLEHQGQPSLIPFIQAAPDARFHILSELAVICEVPADEELAKAYLSATSGILLS